MIAALILGVVGLVLVVSHPEPWVGDAVAVFVIVPLAVWLMLGGGERWLGRRKG